MFSIFDVSNIMFAVSPNLSPIQSVPFLIANPHCYWLIPIVHGYFIGKTLIMVSPEY